MNFQLIQGQFSPSEAIEIITKMIHVKIKFHEGKIEETSSEEEMKMREAKVIKLQKDLYEIRNHINSKKGTIGLQATVEIS